MPLDLEHRRRLNRERREVNAQEREKVLAHIEKIAETEVKDSLYAMDFIPLRLFGAEFTYNPQVQLQARLFAGKENHQELADSEVEPGPLAIEVPSRQSKGDMPEMRPEFYSVMGGWSFDLRQGSLVALVGSRGEGKTTLVRLLGGILLPTKGIYFVPPHLRIFHMPQEPLFMHGTLRENLTFGLPQDDVDGDLDRMVAICTRLGLSQRLINILVNGSLENWTNVLSMTEKVLLHLARAIIANPEVLVLEKPTLVFDSDQTIEVLRVLREFVDQRGLEVERCTHKGEVEKLSRRPRTCIFTASRQEGCAIADEIYEVGMNFVKQVPPSGVTAELLT